MQWITTSTHPRSSSLLCLHSTQEPNTAVAKPIESFTNVLQAVSPKKDDSYDEDSYDMDSYDEDSSEDEELESVGVAKNSNSRKRSRERRRKLLN